MQMANPHHHVEHIPPQQSWGPPQGLPPNAGGGPGFGPTPQYMPPPPPRQFDSYYPPVEMPPPVDKQPHQGISAYGRDASIGVHAPSNTQSAPSMVTQVLFLFQICFLVILKREQYVVWNDILVLHFIKFAFSGCLTICCLSVCGCVSVV